MAESILLHCCLLLLLSINVDLPIFQSYLDLEPGDNQFLKMKWRGRESNPGHLAPQAKSLTTRPPLLLYYWIPVALYIHTDYKNYYIFNLFNYEYFEV